MGRRKKIINEYNADSIIVMGEIEHIRESSGMYIGSTEYPTHLINECLDNSLDEMLAGHCNELTIELDTFNNIYSILDLGRSIPTENNIPITISTKLFSGSKFKSKKTAYHINAGKNGVGMVAINALSTFYKIEIYRDDKYNTYTFENQKLIDQTSITYDSLKRPFSTKISFKPDPEIFENLIPEIDKIRKRLLTSSIQLPECKFILRIDDKEEIIQLNEIDYFKQEILNNDKESTDIINIKINNKLNEEFNVLLSWSLDGPNAIKINSSVNTLPVESGGTHVIYFSDIMKEIFDGYKKKYNKKFNSGDCLIGLRAYLSLMLRETEFVGQTKDKLSIKKSYLDGLIDGVKKGIIGWFDKNEELLIRLLDRFEKYRNGLDNKDLKRNNINKRAATKFTKLRDCSESGQTLYLVEGDSAAGSLIKERDVRKHATFPLKGKIKSAAKKDILKNEEIKELIQALGTGAEPNFIYENLRYDKILITMDQDFDGMHLVCLAILALSVITPELVKRGHVYVVQTPLYTYRNKKELIPIWSQEEYLNMSDKINNVTRYKGLGEFNAEDLAPFLFDENKRRILKVEYTSDINKIINLFTDSEEKRKLLNGEWSLNG